MSDWSATTAVAMTTRTPVFQLPDDFWSHTPRDPNDGRLSGMLGINGTHFHVEALPVTRMHGYQVGADPLSESRLEGLIAEFNVPGFETVRINDRDYVLVITPVAR